MTTEERQLWERCRRGDEEAQHKLVAQHLPLVRFWVNRFKATLYWVSEDDLFQNGVIGLIEAIDRFDPDRGNKFTTYARYHIRNRIWNSAETTRAITRRQRENARRVKQAHDQLMAKLERTPTVAEITEATELSPKQINAALEAMAIGFAESLPEEHDETLIAPKNRPVEGTTAVVVDLEQALSTLSERQRTVLMLRYWQDMPFSEVGQQLGITENHARQIHYRAIQQLRENEPFFGSYEF